MRDFGGTCIVKPSNSNHLVTLLLAGWLSPRRGLSLCLQAVTQLARRGHITLRVAGHMDPMSGPDRKMWDECVDRGILSAEVGFLSNEVFRAAYERSEVVRLPYDRSLNGPSGIMATAIEYGKFIVATDHGCVGYLAQTYGLGCAVSCGDRHAFKPCQRRI